MTGTFRVLGPPFALRTHQMICYLNARRLAVKVHCHSSVEAAMVCRRYKGNCMAGTILPGDTPQQALSLFQLVDRTERLVPHHAEHPSAITNPLELPQVSIVAWAVCVYAGWWLPILGDVIRWIGGNGCRRASEQLIRYFFPFDVITRFGSTGEKILRELTKRHLEQTGLTAALLPVAQTHVDTLFMALEKHFAEQADRQLRIGNKGGRYLLDTSQPTLADVTLSAVISSHFVASDQFTETYPQVYAYMCRLTSASVSAPTTVPSAFEESDFIPVTLIPLLRLMVDVLPVMVGAVESLSDYLGGAECGRFTVRREGQDLEDVEAVLLRKGSVTSWMMVEDEVVSIDTRIDAFEVALRVGEEAQKLIHRPTERDSTLASAPDPPKASLVERTVHTGPLTSRVLPIRDSVFGTANLSVPSVVCQPPQSYLALPPAKDVNLTVQSLISDLLTLMDRMHMPSHRVVPVHGRKNECGFAAIPVGNWIH